MFRYISLFFICNCFLLAQPNTSEILLNKGIQALQHGNYDTAQKSLESIAETDPLAVVPLLQVYTEIGDYTKAVALAKKLSEHPDNALQGFLWLGEIYLEIGEYEKAKSSFMSAYQKKPACIRALFNLGNHAYITGDRKQFLKYCGEVFDNYDPSENYSSEDLSYIAKACYLYAMNSDETDRSDTLKTIVEDILPTAIQKDKYNFSTYQDMSAMFLNAFNHIDAKTSIEEALQMNPHHPMMLYYQAGYFIAKGEQPKAVEALEHALQTNKNLVPALCLKTELCLADEEYKQAQEYLTKALAVNPNHLTALSLQAALYAMQGQEVKYQAQCQKILAINPLYGELYFIVANMVGHKRQFAMVVELQRKAIALDPYLWNAYIELGMSLMHLGQIEEAKKCFEKVQEEYNFHTQTHNMLLLLKKYQEFKIYQNKNFILRLHISEAEVMKPLVEQALDQAFATLVTKYNFTPELPILFEMFPTHDDFSVRTIGLDSLGASGACFGKVVVAVSPKSRRLGDFNWSSVALHELAHVFTLQLSNYQVPRWFTEGLSEFAEYERCPGCQRKHDHDLYSAYSAGKMRGMERLNAGFTRPEYIMEVSICYYQAGLICQYIQEKYGSVALVKMLKLYGQGKKDAEVFDIALQTSLQKFDSDFLAWLQANIFSKLKVFPTIAPNEIIDLKDLIEENPTQENYLKLALSYLQTHQFTNAETYAEEILNHEPTEKNKIIAYDILGQVAFQRQNQAKAQTMLEKAVELGSENFDTRLMLGILYFNQKKLDQAATMLEKAKQSYPNYVGGNSPYLLLAKIYEAMHQNDKRQAEFDTYLKLNAHDFKVRLDLAEEFYKKQNYNQVITLLNEGLEIYPLSTKLHELSARSYEKIGQFKQSQQSYKILLALQPEKEQEIFATELAKVSIQLEDWQSAQQALDKALQVNPDYPEAKKIANQLAKNPKAQAVLQAGNKPAIPITLETKISETQDPTPVNKEFVYITYITNVNKETMKNIKITAQLSDNLTIASVRIPIIRYQIQKNEVTFASISELASGKRVKILIACRPKEVGTAQIRFKISYDGNPSGLDIQETTQITNK